MWRDYYYYCYHYYYYYHFHYHYQLIQSWLFQRVDAALPPRLYFSVVNSPAFHYMNCERFSSHCGSHAFFGGVLTLLPQVEMLRETISGCWDALPLVNLLTQLHCQYRRVLESIHVI